MSSHTRFSDSHIEDEGDEDDYYIPLQSARPFGAGLKRKRISFVPASTEPQPSTIAPPIQDPKVSASAKYLAIVLPSSSESTAETPSAATSTPESMTCAICGQAVTTPRTVHESTIAHQLALQHSHPPSHIDRQRKGLKYLEEYGWDPDSRLGLGARSEGIVVPVKAKEKRDTAGLGLFSNVGDDNEDERRGKSRKKQKEPGPIKVRLNAKQVRQLEDQKRKKAEKLRHAFYGEDLEKYLGPGG